MKSCLFLSRKQKQQIKIGNDIVVTVLQVKGNTVRLGIDAPREVHVIRGELQEKEMRPAPAMEAIKQSPQPKSGKVMELKFDGGNARTPAQTSLVEVKREESRETIEN